MNFKHLSPINQLFLLVFLLVVLHYLLSRLPFLPSSIAGRPTEDFLKVTMLALFLLLSLLVYLWSLKKK